MTAKTNKEKTYLILIGLVALAIIITLIVWLCRPAHEVYTVPEGIEIPQDSTKVVYKEVEKFTQVEKQITSGVIQDGLSDMGFLVTEEYWFTEVVNFSSIKNLLKTDIKLKFTESSYLATYDGKIHAGVDFTGVQVQKNDDAKTITVFLPKAQIISTDIDPASFTLYHEKVGIGNPLSASDFNNSLIELENTAEAKAVARGILTEAQKNAEAVISNFIVSLLGTDEFKIDYQTL